MDPLATSLVTDQNFDAQRYLLGCPDVAEHFAHGLDPWEHFDRHGRHEGRRQLAGLPHIPPGDRSPGVTLCAIAKDEGPYLLEWVAHHRLTGVEKIVVYNNDSSDGSDAMLDRMADAGVIEHRPWPSVAGRAAQITAYADATIRCTTRWILFIDLDEFLTIDGGGTIDDLVRGCDADVSAIGINWLIFGSNGLLARDSRPVIERFTRASARNHDANRHIKTLAVAADVYGLNAHRVQLMRGRYVNVAGEEIDPGHGLIAPCHMRARINHYVLKSCEEFEEKQRRGCALFSPDDPRRLTYRDGNYFKLHDLNEVADETLLETLPALRAEMARIAALLNP